MHTRIGDGVIQIDTLLGGWERMTAGYLVEGDAPVLVETGSQSSVAVLLAALDELRWRAQMTIVFIDLTTGRAIPWPDDLKARMTA